VTIGVDFIEWCDSILENLIGLAGDSPTVRSIGADEYALSGRIFGDESALSADFHESKARAGMHHALGELTNLNLVEERQGHFYRPTAEGEQFAVDETRLWHALCEVSLKPEQEQLLRLVNRLSPHDAPDHAWLESVDQDPLLSELKWEGGFDLLHAVGRELHDCGLARLHTMAGPHLDLTATYHGLVWEFRRGFTLESKFIDDLVAEWETTSVEFKRGLETKTADQRAEFIKDVISLANTKASGRHWMIIGFDDTMREYSGPPNKKIDQEHLEQILSHYTAPVVDIRYSVADYRSGPVGKLEVIRDATKLPYRVAKSIGDKKRIEQGTVFVRHGSLAEKPSTAELETLQAEGDRARTTS
jgi:hypothetical protein